MAKDERPKNMLLAMVLSWLIPGGGHWYLGDRVRAAVFFVAVTLTFWIGILIGGASSTVNFKENTAWFFGEFFAGGYTLLAMLMGSLPGNAASYGKTLDLATIYSGVGGLLNILVILDAMNRTLAPKVNITQESK